jgi:hypothetical protein
MRLNILPKKSFTSSSHQNNLLYYLRTRYSSFCQYSHILPVERIPIIRVALRSNYEMQLAFAITVVLAAVVSALPSTRIHVREQGVCAAVGLGCDFDASECCFDRPGFAFCERNSRKVVFHACKSNACANLKGVASCVDV